MSYLLKSRFHDFAGERGYQTSRRVLGRFVWAHDSFNDNSIPLPKQPWRFRNDPGRVAQAQRGVVHKSLRRRCRNSLFLDEGVPKDCFEP